MPSSQAQLLLPISSTGQISFDFWEDEDPFAYDEEYEEYHAMPTLSIDQLYTAPVEHMPNESQEPFSFENFYRLERQPEQCFPYYPKIKIGDVLLSIQASTQHICTPATNYFAIALYTSVELVILGGAIPADWQYVLAHGAIECIEIDTLKVFIADLEKMKEEYATILSF